MKVVGTGPLADCGTSKPQSEFLRVSVHRPAGDEEINSAVKKYSGEVALGPVASNRPVKHAADEEPIFDLGGAPDRVRKVTTKKLEHP